jgi:hypothetical protein
MANQVSYNAGAQTNMAGSQSNFAFTATFAPVGSKRSDLIVDVDENGEQLSVGQCATVSLFLAQVLTGPEGATASFYADNAYKQVIGDHVPQGMLGCLLFAPLGGIYAKANPAPPAKKAGAEESQAEPQAASSVVVQVRVIAVEL